jgi:hypothetical protein
MEDQFARLEARVDGALELIKELRHENARLQHELAAAREAAEQVTQFETKRRLIEERVGGLLDKLEAMG